MRNTQRDIVVLIHGLGRSARSLLAVRFWLWRAGYRVASVRYPSRKMTVEKAVNERLMPTLEKLKPAEGGRVHFVTHSLGGILFRAWAAKRNPDFPLGRTVMLGPPNQGSEVLEQLGHLPWLRRLLGPVVLELGENEHSVPRQLGPVPPGTGVIMGNKPVIPFFRHLLGPESDGIVTVAGGWVEGQADFMVTPADHTFIMWRPVVLRAVEHFLKNGSFLPQPVWSMEGGLAGAAT
ncbi:hypothetical protein EI77_01122 [Prosthecobacter fusiformis]|uniref:AB hydrolase-1 domain-containing protein n=1 Tax=Prosthecobacter fusiformis TaxID=48464 RepID=A0A4R7SRD0_9BACT|nr:alpha/beta hydrolase [Prosthecobacter fusiformis]TDU81812.1 hypothetical protein EI77_01122 [Prosthecobacter fusiformis]